MQLRPKEGISLQLNNLYIRRPFITALVTFSGILVSMLLLPEIALARGVGVEYGAPGGRLGSESLFLFALVFVGGWLWMAWLGARNDIRYGVIILAILAAIVGVSIILTNTVGDPKDNDFIVWFLLIHIVGVGLALWYGSRSDKHAPLPPEKEKKGSQSPTHWMWGTVAAATVLIGTGIELGDKTKQLPRQPEFSQRSDNDLTNQCEEISEHYLKAANMRLRGVPMDEAMKVADESNNRLFINAFQDIYTRPNDMFGTGRYAAQAVAEEAEIDCLNRH